jgi:clan AA aspartic protease
MGLVHADITLTNVEDQTAHRLGLVDRRIRTEQVRVLVDSGALHLVITPDMQSLLELPKQSRARSVLANGHRIEADIVGPVEVRFDNRAVICQALVIPGADECLLGAIPMEGLDVIIDPAKQQLRVNPESPDMPLAMLKGSKSTRRITD